MKQLLSTKCKDIIEKIKTYYTQQGRSVAKNSDKTFLVFNTACFGDVLLCNSLCQNIKAIYQNSKIVFVVDKPFYEVAKMQKDVDDVVVFDKRGEHKGFWGILRFIKNFEYKVPYASFITYKNMRNCFLAYLLGTKHVIEANNSKKVLSTQIRHNNLLRKITQETIKNYPIKCEVKRVLDSKFTEVLNPTNKYIGLCTISKRVDKDMPIETAKEFIKAINKDNEYKILYLGTGDRPKQYADELKKDGCEFINLVNKTSIYELAQIITNCCATVSIDTGTMHLSYALGVPTIAIFYEEEKIPIWAPDENLYPAKVLHSNICANTIQNTLNNILNDKETIQDV